MGVVRGVVFDVDDTLYLEQEYVRSGFQHIARALSAKIGVPADDLFNSLWSDFTAGVRNVAFNRLVAAFPRVGEVASLEQLVQMYRDHAPEIQLAAEISSLLGTLARQGYRLGALSDGPVASQQAKVTALGLPAFCDPIILTDAWGREFWKPHVRGFEQIAAAWGFQPHEMVYVGDNPEKDFHAPRKLGWRTLRLRIPGQQRYQMEPNSSDYAADAEFTSLGTLPDLLGSL